MEDVLTLVSRLKRPQMMVQTARHGIGDYNRTRHLRHILKTDTVPRSSDALIRLMELDAHLEDLRNARRAEYSYARHVEVLVALMCEARTLRGLRAARASSQSPR